MRRLLIAAQDKDLTRFIAEAMLGRSVQDPPQPDDEWDVARAHTGLEALTLVRHGGRPFDCLLLDPGLPDQDVIEVLSKLRQLEESKDVPVFLLLERGRDPHSRRIASERYRVAGILEKPVTVDGLKAAFAKLERKRRILLVESRSAIAERYVTALRDGGYSVEHVVSGRAALDRVPRLAPDLVVSALILQDAGGAEICEQLKQQSAGDPMRVVLYGQVSSLANTEIAENAHRADDFVQAPFDDEILVERVGMLVGRGIGAKPKRRRKSLAGAATSQTNPGSEIGRSTLEGPTPLPHEQVPGPPPPSASPAPSSPARRSTRRVPCNLSMRVENGGRRYESKTLDISHGGIFLATDEPMEIGTKIQMRFQLPDSENIIEAVGKVAWVGAGGVDGAREGVGVKFSRIDPVDLKLIVDYVNRVSRVVYSAT